MIMVKRSCSQVRLGTKKKVRTLQKPFFSRGTACCARFLDSAIIYVRGLISSLIQHPCLLGGAREAILGSQFSVNTVRCAQERTLRGLDAFGVARVAAFLKPQNLVLLEIHP